MFQEDAPHLSYCLNSQHILHIPWNSPDWAGRVCGYSLLPWVSIPSCPAQISSASPVSVHYIFWFFPRDEEKKSSRREELMLTFSRSLFPYFPFALYAFSLDTVPHFLTEGTLKSDTSNQRPWCKEMSWIEPKHAYNPAPPPHTHIQGSLTATAVGSKKVGALIQAGQIQATLSLLGGF